MEEEERAVWGDTHNQRNQRINANRRRSQKHPQNEREQMVRMVLM